MSWLTASRLKKEEVTSTFSKKKEVITVITPPSKALPKA